MGAPTKLTAAVQTRVIDALAHGATRTEAAEAAGVHRATLLRWLARGQARGAPARLQKFAEAVAVAEGTPERVAEQALLRSIRQGSWRAALALLERRHPGKWARIPSEEAVALAREEAAAEGGAWDLGDIDRLTDEELEQLQRLLSKSHAA